MPHGSRIRNFSKERQPPTHDLDCPSTGTFGSEAPTGINTQQHVTFCTQTLSRSIQAGKASLQPGNCPLVVWERAKILRSCALKPYATRRFVNPWTRCVLLANVRANQAQAMQSSSDKTSQLRVSFTIDVEGDCPPYLNTDRGLSEGMPKLLDLLGELRIPATFFTTGDSARSHGEQIRRLVADGHELACHGDQHLNFSTINREAAARDLKNAMDTLRSFASPTSFRAPYLRYPMQFLPLLLDVGITLDSSQARYKRGPEHRVGQTIPGLCRVPASMTSSALRLPPWLRNPWMACLQSPVVLFVHPWEFVDWRRTNLRLDCRFKTGDAALQSVRDVFQYWRDRSAIFCRMNELGAQTL